MTLRCDLLAVGTELLLGQIVDSNSAWLGERLAAAGIASHLHVQVGDNVGRIERQLRAGRARKNIIAKVPEEPDQGLDTKDNVNVDWHNPNYKQVRNPSE